MSMKMYAAYIKERENAELIQTNSGWAAYRVCSDHVYLTDIYVVPEARHTGACRELFEIVCAHALEAGLHRVAGSVVPSVKGAHYSMEIMLAEGFRLHAADKDIVYFIKEI